MKGDLGIVSFTNNIKEAIPSAASLHAHFHGTNHSVITQNTQNSNILSSLDLIRADRNSRDLSDESYIGQIFYAYPHPEMVKGTLRYWLDSMSPFADSKPINVFVDVDEKRTEAESLAKRFNEQVEAGEKKDFMLTATTKYPEIDQLCDLIDAMTKLANSSFDDECE